MHFTSPIAFEIPDDIWILTGASQWRPSRSSYVASAYQDAESNQPHNDLSISLIPIHLIEPPRTKSTARALVNFRLERILKGFVTSSVLPAVLGQQKGNNPIAHVEIIDGAHRYYASIAVGFTHLPVALRKFYLP